MKEVLISTARWAIELPKAIREADAETIIVVDSELKAKMVQIAAERMKKMVVVKVSDTIL